MPRLARVVVSGLPHHITQRGNRRMETFFRDEDYVKYIELMGEWCGKLGVEIWAYCLMPNHVHLIAVPTAEEGLARAIGEAHRRYKTALFTILPRPKAYSLKPDMVRRILPARRRRYKKSATA